MARLFDEHIKREVICLDGSWRSVTDSEDAGEKKGFSKGLPLAHTVIIPSVWNIEQGMLEYEGVVWYEKDFYTRGGTLRFCFGAVMTYAKVYLDGELLGDHYGGFCKFCFTKNEVSAGYHKLVVRVDNRFDKISIPHSVVDWYHYGGITRSVEVHRLEGITVLYSFLDYDLENDSANCRLRVELFNASPENANDTITASINDRSVAQKQITLTPHETKTITLTFRIEKIKLWSENAPILYRLSTESTTDDLIDRVGFRKVRVEGRRVLINDTEIFLRGINRHEDHPEFGMAFPPLLMKRDLEIIEAMNCNAIRGSHYPNDPMFIDMLDERGILFWSEIPMWGPGYNSEVFSDPVFVKRAMDMHREMVREYYNHPSIIIWGIFNETDTTSEITAQFTKNCYDLLKEEGGGRLVTFATNKLNKDVCLKYCDIISMNIYVGWYDSEEKEFATWEGALSEMDRYFEETGVENKPLIMSEFGAAALYGYHTFDNLKWTEEYQAELIGKCLELFYGHPGYVGTYVWQFSDIRTAKEAGLNRARSYNNKGVLNEFRRPKLAYTTVKNIYKKFKESSKT